MYSLTDRDFAGYATETTRRCLFLQFHKVVFSPDWVVQCADCIGLPHHPPSCLICPNQTTTCKPQAPTWSPSTIWEPSWAICPAEESIPDNEPFARYDVCQVCKGDGSTCAGCDGVPASGKAYDLCEECGRDDYNDGCVLVVMIMSGAEMTEFSFLVHIDSFLFALLGA